MKNKRTLIYMLLTLAGLTAAAQSHSVLSSGRWWKVGATEEGVYRVTTGDISALAGASVDSLAVYGIGGGMLPLENRLTSTDDLRQVASEVVDRNGNGRFDSGDELLFFGEGAEGWHYEGGQWLFEHHAYARENYYYITTTCNTPLRIAAAPAVEADTVLSTHTVVVNIDNDLVSPTKSGRLWMGEKFSSTLTSRTFSPRLPATSVSDVKLRYAVASTSTSSALFTLSTQGFDRDERMSSTQHYRTGSANLTITNPNPTFTITYSPAESSGNGYLDFIELTAHAPLSFSGGQLTVRNDQHLGSTVRFALGGNDFRVWEVTRAGAEREMTFDATGWSDSTPLPRRYIVFDSWSYHSPVSIKEIDNQDLHGCPAAELVIVAHPLFLPQAQRLAALHELFDGMSTFVTTDEAVYNEFSSGKQDPMAIRALLRWMKETHGDLPPRYLILFGRGTYDNRDLMGKSLPTVVTYETEESFDDDGLSYASDDMLGYLDANEYGSSSETLDVSVGRLPAADTVEAAHMVDKIEGYLTRRDLVDESVRGDWRNYVALLADDADPAHPGDSLFAHSSEVVATAIKTSMPQFNIDRLYADSYHQESGAIGSYYPDLNNALRQRINYGCLLLNYIGHGSTTYIGTERYIELADLSGYTNVDRLPVLVTSTCSYGHYDDPDERCGAEAALLAPAGMVSVISAARPISHIERFNKDVVLFALTSGNTIGDALRIAKGRTTVSPCIGILGDPALRLSLPDNRVRVTHINHQAVDDSSDVSAEVLSRVTVSGEIVDSLGNLVDDFDGTVYPVVFDREVHTSTLANDNPNTQVAFSQQKNVLYKGAHPVTGGRFEYSFIVPKDVAYSYDYAKLSHYAKSASDHASGSFSRLMLGGLNDSLPDNLTPPSVTLFMGDTNFRPCGITGPSPTLLALLHDSAGINVGTGLGHDITAVVDDNPNSLIVLNDLYQQDILDSRGGSVTYTFQALAPGRHTVTVKAWNIYGLSASAEVAFIVHGNDSLVFSDLVCAPNPASDVARFTLRVNQPDQVASAELQIYSTRGQLILKDKPNITPEGFIIGPVAWNVSAVPPGLYLARMVVIDTEGETHQITTKCIVY